jgi:hypothetical protein
MSARKMTLLLLASLCLPLASMFNPAYAQNNGNANTKKLQVGYVVVTPSAANTSGLAVFETFGEMRFGGAIQAGVLPADLVTRAMLFVTASSRLSRDLGVAIANPQSTDAPITFTLCDSDGKQVATKTVSVKALNQSAQFITQLFAGQLPLSGEFDGTLFVSSTVTTPVAMVGLRFRGENFSAIPVTVLSLTYPVPTIGSTQAGGAGAVILPQFADGGGWASELVLSNSGTSDLVVRVDVFNQDGSPMTVTLNGVTASSFKSLTIKPGGVIILAPRNRPDDDDDF